MRLRRLSVAMRSCRGVLAHNGSVHAAASVVGVGWGAIWWHQGHLSWPVFLIVLRVFGFLGSGGRPRPVDQWISGVTRSMLAMRWVAWATVLGHHRCPTS